MDGVFIWLDDLILQVASCKLQEDHNLFQLKTRSTYVFVVVVDAPNPFEKDRALSFHGWNLPTVEGNMFFHGLVKNQSELSSFHHSVWYDMIWLID